MSLIAGIVFYDGRPVENQLLVRMLATSSPPSARDFSYEILDSIGMGTCQSRAPTGPKAHNSPFLIRNEQILLAADARVDNRNELIPEIAGASPVSAGIEDGRLIELAYEKWGQACPEKLIGDYSFVVWDIMNRTLFCARDHAGVKPFYYFQSPLFFAFATDIKALLRLEEIPKRVNEGKVADHLLGDFRSKSNTFYQAVHRLPPGSRLTIQDRHAQLHTYWSPDPRQKLPDRKDHQYAEAFRGIFVEAIRCRMANHGAVGALLSGGLDSSSITCVAASLALERGEGPLQTFSAVFPGLGPGLTRFVDERPYIEAVAAKAHIDSRIVPAVHSSPLAHLDEILHTLGEPFVYPNIYLPWALFQAAQQEEIRVLLDGSDGDATVSTGLDHLTDLARRARWGALFRQIQALQKNGKGAFDSRQLFWTYAIRPWIPRAVIDVSRRVRARPQFSDRYRDLIHPDFAHRMNLFDRVGDASGPKPTAKAPEKHLAEMTSGQIAYSLELLDKISASFGVQVRYPFFDRRLMEYCLAVPASQKLMGGWTRSILRRAMAGVLPEIVQSRTSKADLYPLFLRLLQSSDRFVIERIFAEKTAGIRAFVNVEAFKTILPRAFSDPNRHRATMNLVYSAAILARWLSLSQETA